MIETLDIRLVIEPGFVRVLVHDEEISWGLLEPDAPIAKARKEALGRLSYLISSGLLIDMNRKPPKWRKRTQ